MKWSLGRLGRKERGSHRHTSCVELASPAETSVFLKEMRSLRVSVSYVLHLIDWDLCQEDILVRDL
jgi:hypothetical protein